jgi:methionyl-tRNA synthetase
MSNTTRRILVTNALPYANGEIHLGHLLGYIQTDIWARFQRLRGHECYYICGSDCHGTPIMLRAEKENITPEALVEKVAKDHLKDFQGFYIEFDNFYSTHSPENKKLVEEIFQKLESKNFIKRKTIHQAFDPEKNLFLPDRYVMGECPKCHAKDQYGDSCESCGSTYLPTDLINPVSVVSGATPIQKESEHLFFDLPQCEEKLKRWITEGHLQPEISHKLEEWFTAGLREWDISRDSPYFGFEIPSYPEKYFYVWLDAPIGYMSSFQHFCHANPPLKFDDFWQKENNTELYHFMGKDIVYFHALFWPAVLMSADYRLPNAIYATGFITINGRKMSKSRGTFITAKAFLNKINPEFLRYYYANKLSPSVEDIDLNFEDFRLRVNSDLIGKYVNIASRCAGFIKKYFESRLSATLDFPALLDEMVSESEMIAQYYEARDFSRAMKVVMKLADKANQYIAEKEPWSLIKDPKNKNQVHDICTTALNLFRVLSLYLKPILPETAIKCETFLNVSPLRWDEIKLPLLDHTINQFSPLMQRVDESAIKDFLEEGS